jgi:flavin reductase (DIM6/NTAB) family NADH-FMN oxidoreductase RutF
MSDMLKRILNPDTTLYPVAVVLITSGGENPNVMTCNRIISCSAEPPRLAVSVRPSRYTHDLILETGEFVVNIPTPKQSKLSDYLGVVTGRNEDKITIAGLKLAPAEKVKTPLLADCPVNIECGVESFLELDSHTMFIGQVLAVHADETVIDNQGDVDISLALGLVYDSGVVRERPTYKFQVDDLRQEQHLR